MPSKSVHSAIISKKRYANYRYAKNKFGDGIHVLWGIDAEGKVHVASIKFDKDKFRGDDAKYWLKEHDYDIQWFVDAEETKIGDYMEKGNMNIEENEISGLSKDWTATNIRLRKVAERSNKPHYKHLNPLQKSFVKAKERYDIILLEMKKMEYRDPNWRKTEFGGKLLEDYLHSSNRYHRLLNKLDIDEVQGQELYNSAHSSRYYGGSYGLEDEENMEKCYNLEGLSNKELTKKIIDNFEQIKEFADKTYPVPVETRLGLTTINIYNKKDRVLIGQIDLEEGIILEGQIDMYSGKVETDEFLPYTKRLRDFIMQPGRLSVKAEEQAQLFGIGKMNPELSVREEYVLNNVTSHLKQKIIKFKRLWLIQEEKKQELDNVASFQAMNQWSDHALRVSDRWMKSMDAITELWNDMRSSVVKNGKTLWQISLKKYPAKNYGQEIISPVDYIQLIDMIYDEIESPYKTEESGQSKMFGIGKISSQSREERWIKLNDRFEWIKNRLSDARRQKIEEPLLKAKELLGIELNCEVSEKSLLISGDTTKIATQTERIPAYYAIAELFYLQPSHNYQDYSKNQCYPENCQTRDYSGDKVEKEKILRIIRDFDPIHLVTDNPSALEGPPVITEPGIVLGGNSRSIALQILAKDTIKYDSLYLPALKKKIDGFGFSKNALSKFRNPVLVRIIDIPLSKCSTYSNMLNKGQTQEMNEVTEAIALARQFEEKSGAFENIAQIISENDSDSTFKELINSPETAGQIIKELEKSGIINPSNTNEWLSGPREFSDKGKTLLEFMLLASILPDKTLLDQVGSYSSKILRAIPQLIIIKSLSPEWNIIPEIQKAVKLEYQRRQTGAISTPEQLINQTSIDSGKIDEKTANVWMILHYSTPRKFKPLMEKYIKMAKGSQGGSMFSEEKTKPEDVLKFYAEYAKSGKGLEGLADYSDNSTVQTEQCSVPANLGDVIAVPDADLTVPELKVDESPKLEAISLKPEAQNLPASSSQLPTPADELPTLPTTTDIMNSETKGKPLILKRIKPLLGRLLEPCSILIYGEEGQGKTSLAMIAAEDLKLNGQVFYMLADKGTIDTRIKEQLNRLKIKSDIIFYPSQDWANPGVEQYLKADAKDKDGKPYNIKFVIIDKIGDVDNIEKNDWWNIRIKYPDISFIFIAQMDKAGKKYVGDSNLAYKVDTIIEVSSLVAKTVKKHRDGEVGKAMPVLETKSTWDWKENMAKAS